MEDAVLKAFLYNNRLRFAEIEKLVGERSNKLSYHIKNLVKKSVLEKEDEFYKLTDKSLELIPYLSDKRSALAVILVAIKKNNNQVYLIKRKKRPFFGKLSLPGGRIEIAESIPDATKRIAKKFGVNVSFEKVCSVSHEHVTKGERIVHSFLLVFVLAKSDDDIEYVNVRENKRNIIDSDYKLITADLSGGVDLKELFTEE